MEEKTITAFRNNWKYVSWSSRQEIAFDGKKSNVLKWMFTSEPMPPLTMPTTASTTDMKKRSGSGVLIPPIEGGAVLLVLLSGGAAALASSSG